MSSREALLPPELLRVPEELARVDALLDDPAFFAPFVPYFHPGSGRRARRKQWRTRPRTRPASRAPRRRRPPSGAPPRPGSASPWQDLFLPCAEAHRCDLLACQNIKTTQRSNARVFCLRTDVVEQLTIQAAGVPPPSRVDVALCPVSPWRLGLTTGQGTALLSQGGG